MCVCVQEGWELTFGGGGASNFSAGDGGTPIPSPSPPLPPPLNNRKNSAIPETKLGHKTQQNYNRLNYKMYKNL